MCMCCVSVSLSVALASTFKPLKGGGFTQTKFTQTKLSVGELLSFVLPFIIQSFQVCFTVRSSHSATDVFEHTVLQKSQVNLYKNKSVKRIHSQKPEVGYYIHTSLKLAKLTQACIGYTQNNPPEPAQAWIAYFAGKKLFMAAMQAYMGF